MPWLDRDAVFASAGGLDELLLNVLTDKHRLCRTYFHRDLRETSRDRA